MATSLLRKPYALALFGLLMCGCAVLLALSVSQAYRDVGQPWAGFAFNKYGVVMQAYDTDLVIFDKILAVDGHRLPTGPQRGPALRAYLHQLAPQTPVTYTLRRNGQVVDVTHATRTLRRQDLARRAGIGMLVGIGQLVMGAIVFLLRPHTRRSWIFLAFCLAWFGLCLLLYDFQSTFVFNDLFFFCWFMSSALMLHLAFVFPDERRFIQQKPWLQALFYAPSLLMWLPQILCALPLAQLAADGND